MNPSTDMRLYSSALALGDTLLPKIISYDTEVEAFAKAKSRYTTELYKITYTD